MYQVIAIEEYVTEMIVLVTDPLGGLDPFYIQYVNAQDIWETQLEMQASHPPWFGLAGWKLVDCNGLSF